MTLDLLGERPARYFRRLCIPLVGGRRKTAAVFDPIDRAGTSASFAVELAVYLRSFI
jgi:hypothetical protein